MPTGGEADVIGAKLLSGSRARTACHSPGIATTENETSKPAGLNLGFTFPRKMTRAMEIGVLLKRVKMLVF